MTSVQYTYYEKIEQAAQFIRQSLHDNKFQPQFVCILGSGLGDVVEHVEDAVHIPFSEIPHFPLSTVSGHAGQIVIGKLAGVAVVLMQGRIHYYEGYTMQDVVLPVYIMNALGVHSLLVTNACGGMNPSYRAGDFMMIHDHLNLTGDHPLVGANDDRLGVRFPDMTNAYDVEYRLQLSHVAETIMRNADVKIHAGVYAGISGPSYMTPAELKLLRTCGGDVVGMSTVAEVIAARHAGLRVVGISCITDMAVAEHLEVLTHEQVIAVANRSKPVFIELILRFFQHIQQR